MFTFHQPFALQLGIERLQAFFIAYAVAAMAARLGLGHWADRLGRKPVSVAALALYACAVASMIGLRPGGLAPIGAVFGLAHGLFYPAFNGLAMEGVSERERGKVMALFQGWFNLGFSIFAILLGPLADIAGYRVVFLSAALATASALLLLIRSEPLSPVSGLDVPST